MSPVRTTTRSFWGRHSRLFSSRLVLPEPGELMRLRQRMPCSLNRARRPAAMRSFSLRTFFSIGIRSIFLHLPIGQFQLIAAQALAAQASATGALEKIILHAEFSAAIQTAMPARANLNFQPQRLKFGF